VEDQNVKLEASPLLNPLKPLKLGGVWLNFSNISDFSGPAAGKARREERKAERTPEDVECCGDAKSAILEYYRTGNTKTYDLAAVAHDLSRWPPIAAYVRQLKVEQREKRAAEERESYRKRKFAN